MGKRVRYLCMSPGVAMNALKREVRSIILTSGTLTPFNSFALELRMEFKIILENKHVVKKDQVTKQ